VIWKLQLINAGTWKKSWVLLQTFILFYHLVLELGLETSTLSSCADMTAKQTQLVHPRAELWWSLPLSARCSHALEVSLHHEPSVKSQNSQFLSNPKLINSHLSSVELSQFKLDSHSNALADHASSSWNKVQVAAGSSSNINIKLKKI
jgi:hypothetical protein